MAKDNKTLQLVINLKGFIWVVKPYRAAKIYDKEIYEYNKL